MAVDRRSYRNMVGVLFIFIFFIFQGKRDVSRAQMSVLRARSYHAPSAVHFITHIRVRKLYYTAPGEYLCEVVRSFPF